MQEDSPIVVRQAEVETLLDLVSEAVLVRDTEGRIVYWNLGAERMYGWTKEEAIGRSAFDMLSTVLPQPLEEIQATLLRDGLWAGELAHTKKDGSTITVDSRWTVRKDDAGGVIGWVQVNDDITERKRDRQTLLDAEEGLRMLIDGVRDYAIFRLDPGGHILTWNTGAQRIKGYQADEVIGKHFSIFYMPQDVARGHPAE